MTPVRSGRPWPRRILASDSNPDHSAFAEVQCDFVWTLIGPGDDIVGYGMATTVPEFGRGNRHENGIVLHCRRSYRNFVNCIGERPNQNLGHHDWQLLHNHLADGFD
jgi:hypothetical protein